MRHVERLARGQDRTRRRVTILRHQRGKTFDWNMHGSIPCMEVFLMDVIIVHACMF